MGVYPATQDEPHTTTMPSYTYETTMCQHHPHRHLQEQRASLGALQCPASWTKSSILGWTSPTRRGSGLQGSSTILLTLPSLETITQGTKRKVTPIRALLMCHTCPGPTIAIWCPVAIVDTQSMCTSPRSTKLQNLSVGRQQDTEDIMIFCCPDASNQKSLHSNNAINH